MRVLLVLSLLHTSACEDETYVSWHQKTYTNLPAARALAPAVVQHTVHSTPTLGRYVWVFGGLSSTGAALNDLWKLDMLSGVWNEQLAGGVTPIAPRRLDGPLTAADCLPLCR